MSSEVQAIKRGMIVRHKGRICYVRHVAAGYAYVEPAYCRPESVPVAECEALPMSLASPRSREYWPRGGGGNE